jgi:hypothetical protein
MSYSGGIRITTGGVTLLRVRKHTGSGADPLTLANTVPTHDLNFDEVAEALQNFIAQT